MKNPKATEIEVNPKRWRDGRIAVLCPFHQEKTPSLTVTMLGAGPECSFRCLSCGTEGSATMIYEANPESFSLELRPSVPKEA